MQVLPLSPLILPPLCGMPSITLRGRGHPNESSQMQIFSFKGSRLIFAPVRKAVHFVFGDSRFVWDAKKDANGMLHSESNGQFVRKGTEGVTQSYRTWTKERDTEGRKVANKEPANEKMKRLKAVKDIHSKGGYTRESLKKYKDVKRNPAQLISEFKPEELYVRSDARIEYPDEESAKDKPKYEWTIGGRKLDETEALQLETALTDIGANGGLSKDASDVKVRPDLFNGRGQIFSAKGVPAYSDPYTNYDRNKAKYERVNYWSDNYDKLLDKIEDGVKSGDDAAYLAYFMHRTRCRVGTSNSADGLGASQLKAEHVKLDGQKIICDFPAKNGQWHIEIDNDPILHSYISKRLAEADPKERLFKTSSDKEGKYLKRISDEVTGGKAESFGNHDFRRVGATTIVSDFLKGKQAEIDDAIKSKDDKRYNALMVEAINEAAKYLNDKPTTAFEHYIAPERLFKDKPELIDAYTRNFSKLGKSEGDEYDEIKK